MEPHYPLSAKRLHALLGETMHDIPAHFIERLELKLEELEDARGSVARLANLRLVSPLLDEAPLLPMHGNAARGCTTRLQVPAGVLQGLASIFEILHSVHLARQDGDPEAILSEHLVEGLIVSGRQLLRAADAM